MSRYPMTVGGAEALNKELSRLKSETRPQIIEAIATARALGDLKENAEYHAAREQQSFTEGRIKEIEAKLSNAQIIDTKKIANTGKVVFGVTVKLYHVSQDADVVYTIVGEDEADIKANKISYNAPIGRALIGKMVGDSVFVDTPDGKVEYEIVSVDH